MNVLKKIAIGTAIAFAATGPANAGLIDDIADLFDVTESDHGPETIGSDGSHSGSTTVTTATYDTGTSVSPNVTITTNDPRPNKEPSDTNVSVGVTIPFDF